MTTEKEKLSENLVEESKKCVIGFIKTLVWTAIGFAGLYKAFGRWGDSCEALGKAETYTDILSELSESESENNEE